jgi:hypothetical protein
VALLLLISSGPPSLGDETPTERIPTNNHVQPEFTNDQQIGSPTTVANPPRSMRRSTTDEQTDRRHSCYGNTLPCAEVDQSAEGQPAILFRNVDSEMVEVNRLKVREREKKIIGKP